MGSSAAYARARETILRICRGEADARTLRLEVLDAIRRATGFDAYAWLLTDPETSVGSSPLADVPSVYRDRFGCWGFLDLWRTDAPPFSVADIEFLGHIARPVTTALRHGLARTFIPATGGDQMPGGPVVLLLSPGLVVRAQTPQTQRYLRVLVPPEPEDQAPVPAGAYNVAAQLLAVEAGVDDSPPATRVHLADGRWLTLRAARMEDTGQAPEDRDVAVGIEPSTAGDRVSVFARACGLSPRETELLHHLAGGAGTRDVARQMFVSENTRPGPPQVNLRQERRPQPASPARPGARHLTACSWPMPWICAGIHMTGDGRTRTGVPGY